MTLSRKSKKNMVNLFFPSKFTILNNFEAEKKHFFKVINQKNTKGPAIKRVIKLILMSKLKFKIN